MGEEVEIDVFWLCMILCDLSMWIVLLRGGDLFSRGQDLLVHAL